MKKYCWKILYLSAISRFRCLKNRPLSSTLLRAQLRQRNYPHWTAWYVPYYEVENDLWGKSHFNFDVDGINYHILRTGAFPFIKFHCTARPIEDLKLEDLFYRVLKVTNLGFPTLLYGISGLLWANHIEDVYVTKDEIIRIYFWYTE